MTALISKNLKSPPAARRVSVKNRWKLLDLLHFCVDAHFCLDVPTDCTTLSLVFRGDIPWQGSLLLPRANHLKEVLSMSDETGEERRPLLIRLPHEVASWIEKEAARNRASRNSEIIRAIRLRMDTEPKRVA
jgi:hypothetical protein